MLCSLTENYNSKLNKNLIYLIFDFFIFYKLNIESNLIFLKININSNIGNNAPINQNNIQKENTNSNIVNNKNNTDIYHNNNTQKIVLNSVTKKNPANNEVKSNAITKGKYEDDFEEYEMSDSSNKGEDEDDEDEEMNLKFIPKWAMDEEYINNQIKMQNNNRQLILKSFGNFVVENLNLNMIFETHNEIFDMRNSTADWRGEDSFAKNKVTNINDKEIDDMFPNRKLQF